MIKEFGKSDPNFADELFQILLLFSIRISLTMKFVIFSDTETQNFLKILKFYFEDSKTLKCSPTELITDKMTDPFYRSLKGTGLLRCVQLSKRATIDMCRSRLSVCLCVLCLNLCVVCLCVCVTSLGTEFCFHLGS